MVCRELLLLAWLAVVCEAFIGSGDDAYMKKYAIRKVWESCFGSDVVKQIRLEKRAAIAKCRSYTAPPPPSPVSHPSHPGPMSGLKQLTPAELALVLATQQHLHHAVDKMGVAHQGRNQSGSGAAEEGPEPRPETSMNLRDHFPAKKRPSVQQQHIDPARLQALFGYSPPLNAYQQMQPAQQYNPFLNAAGNNFPYLQQPAAQYGGMAQYGGYSTGGLQQHPGAHPSQLYQPAASGAYYGQQQAFPYYPQPQAPFYPLGYYGNGRQRPARELNGQPHMDLEALQKIIGAKADNVSCQLQELGYLDEDLRPDYGKISIRVKRLPVEEELKRDMLDGLEFCKRFSQCMPDMRKDSAKASKDQDKQMFFFSCYKHKKLEACLMKDVRERFMTDDPLTQEDLTGDDLRSLPRGRRAKMPDFAEPSKPDEFDDFFQNDDDIHFV